MAFNGFRRPFQRDGKGGFVKGSGDDLIVDRIEAICASSGEVPWNPALSSGLDRIRSKNNSPILAQFAQVYVQTAVATFEPDVTDVQVTATSDGETLTLTVDSKLNGRALPQANVTL